MTFAASVWMFIKSPVGRYTLAAIAVVVLFLGLRLHFLHQGQLEGKQEAQSEFKTAIEAERQESRQQLDKALQAADEKFNLAASQLNAATAREQAAADTIRDLSRQRDAAANQVKGLKDGELHPFITKALGIRAPADLTPGYNFLEERAIASCVTDEPLCKKTVAGLGNDVDALRGKVDALGKQVEAEQQRANSLGNYTASLEGYYTDLYNSFPRRRNWPLTIITAGIAGKPKKLNTPDPEILKGAKPK